MSETKHTPGPWIAVWREDLGKFRIGPDNGDMPVAGTVNQGDREHEEANARLIASAPELLEALKQMVAAMWQHFEYNHDGDDEDYDFCQRAIDKARAAIAKAERGQS